MWSAVLLVCTSIDRAIRMICEYLSIFKQPAGTQIQEVPQYGNAQCGPRKVNRSTVTLQYEYDMVRAANNLHYFFSAQVPVSPGRAVCLVSEKHH